MVDLEALKRALHAHGKVVRVVIAGVKGSTPREVGAAMIVSREGLVSGTIGGGTLEHEAITKARHLSAPVVDNRALGPDLGQCCGGAVTLVYDRFDTMPDVQNGLILRRITGTNEAPLALRRKLAEARNGNLETGTQLIDGWLIEPVQTPTTPLWVWGAGHVGRAMVTTAAPLPDLDIKWIDTSPDRFPERAPESVTVLPAARPERLVAHAPANASHLILTYSHALDLALCDALLRHDFAFAGLIGSRSKWARFRHRLSAAGHSSARIDSITCPIGDPSMGKHPQEIAISTLWALKTQMARQDALRDMTG
ncbi:xanthine dehydrogenase accessory protein XdhC [Pseudooceanicola sp. MF1-13]|uniref:xanthine dehydrogenase accessory protein XdhC n=1 Tax=Pseudooceanicola sp. MF1-13 TaxID=3379095 RepID=UPI003891A76E